MVEIGLSRLYWNVAGHKYLKENAKLLKRIGHRGGSTDNVINISTGPSTYWSKNCINFSLQIRDRIVVSHNWDLKSFLAQMRHHRKHESVIWMQTPLVEKGSGIEHCPICTALHVCYNVWLQRQWVRVGDDHVVKLANIYYGSLFSLSLDCFPDHKYRKAKECMRLCIDKSSLSLEFVEGIVN